MLLWGGLGLVVILGLGSAYYVVFSMPGHSYAGAFHALRADEIALRDRLRRHVRLLAGRQLARTVRFVAFVNEEGPFFQTDAMGSWVYARRSHARGEQIVAMLSIETIGFYSDVAGSQHYPFPFGLFYPRTGNFIGFVGNIASRALVQRSLAAFREHTALPSEGVAAPGSMTGIGWSDHWAFWHEGYPALMVTDTALFRYAPYHTR